MHGSSQRGLGIIEGSGSGEAGPSRRVSEDAGMGNVSTKGRGPPIQEGNKGEAETVRNSTGRPGSQ